MNKKHGLVIKQATIIAGFGVFFFYLLQDSYSSGLFKAYCFQVGLYFSFNSGLAHLAMSQTEPFLHQSHG